MRNGKFYHMNIFEKKILRKLRSRHFQIPVVDSGRQWSKLEVEIQFYNRFVNFSVHIAIKFLICLSSLIQLNRAESSKRNEEIIISEVDDNNEEKRIWQFNLLFTTDNKYCDKAQHCFSQR